MTEFIHFEAEIDNVNSSDNDENNDNVSEISFIDDSEIDTTANFYRQFENIENDLDQVLSDIQQEALQDIEQFEEISNLNDDSDDEMEMMMMILKNQKLILKNFITPSFQKK